MLETWCVTCGMPVNVAQCWNLTRGQWPRGGCTGLPVAPAVVLLASQMVQCSEVWQQESLVPSRATLCPS